MNASPNGVEVDAGDTFRADATVVAVPVRLVTELSFDPPLSAEQREAFEGLPMGVASKVAVPLRGDPQGCAIQCADLPFWFWVADGPDGTRRVVTSFAGSDGQHASILEQGPLEQQSYSYDLQTGALVATSSRHQQGPAVLSIELQAVRQ